jgi:hypothetical protein
MELQVTHASIIMSLPTNLSCQAILKYKKSSSGPEVLSSFVAIGLSQLGPMQLVSSYMATYPVAGNLL